MVEFGLRTLNQALRPQTAAARREGIAQAVLFIGLQQFTAAAGRAGRKGKTVHALAVLHVVRIEPQVEQIGGR